MPKPAGFFDPRNPAELPPKRLQKDMTEERGAGAEEGDEAEESAEEGERPGRKEEEDDDDDDDRSPLLSFANTDMAFAGDVMVAGSYHGFNVYRLVDGGPPELLSSVVCPGGQGDVSIVGDLLIMSVEQTRGTSTAGSRASMKTSARRALPRTSHPRHQRLDATGAGGRGPDLPRLAHPLGGLRPLGGPDASKIIVYNSGTSSVREEEELARLHRRVPPETTAPPCFASMSSRSRSTTRPRRASSIARRCSPIRKRAFLAGLWKGGDHGEKDDDDTQETGRPTSATTSPSFRSAGSPPAPARATASCSTSPIR